MTTIKEVAKHAGVSVATVSRALNKSGYVGEESKRKVEKAIKELNYVPNEVARSLFQKTSKMIGLLLPDISNPYFPLVAKGVEDCAQEKGYIVILGNVEDNPEKEDNYVKFFSRYNISGVLSAAVGKKNKHANGPYVLLDRADEKEIYAISTDDLTGGKLAALAVADQVQTKVIVMAGPQDVPGAQDRLAGNLEILKSKQVNYEVFETHTFQIDKAEEVAVKLFESNTNFDTIIASNDVFALATLTEALKRGYRIPEELQIIGYDNIPFSRYTYPGLTTIAQPAYEVGYQGAEMLIRLIEKKEIDQPNVKLKPELITRETVR